MWDHRWNSSRFQRLQALQISLSPRRIEIFHLELRQPAAPLFAVPSLPLLHAERKGIDLLHGSSSTLDLILHHTKPWQAVAPHRFSSDPIPQIVATDMSHDHKPDLPEEYARIIAAGGMVTPPGPNGRPARVG